MTTKDKARYLKLADELRSSVLRGEFAHGKPFPTESALCRKYEVSRFTVREALKQLIQDGLIVRKRGSGTVVQPSSARGGMLHQPLSNVGEILQYAKNTTISLKLVGKKEIDAAIAEKIGISVPGEWFLFHGVRKAPGTDEPISLTYAWVHPDLADAVEKIDDQSPTLFVQLAEHSGRVIQSVTQDIQAVSAGKDVAEVLGVEVDSSLLLILRSYFDGNGHLFEISANYHPGERFTYSMHIEAD